MNKNTKTLLAALFLAAYLAVVLKWMVSMHHVPSGMVPGMEPHGMTGPPGMGAPGGGVAPGVHHITHRNLVPFRSIVPYLRGSPTWHDALRNLLGNTLLFMPLGFLLPLLYRPISWKGVLGIAAAFSLCIESLQLVLRAGIFDVDDILLNTLGAMLGYLVFLLLTEGFAHPPGRHLRRWGTVRLRMTLWNVAVLALILGAMGGVVRYKVRADRFAVVDRTLAERANEAGQQYAFIQSHTFRENRSSVRFRRVDPMAAPAGWRPRALPPLPPRFLPRDLSRPPAGEPREEPWDRHAYHRSLDGLTVYSTILDGGVPMRVLSTPIESGGRVDRVLQLAYPLGSVQREIDGLTSTLLALVPFGLLAAGMGGAFLTGRALRPVREIAGTAARLGVNDLSERLPVSGRDEFSELAESINAMLARLEEAFDRQRRFTADASHELRTPLSIVKANTGLALEHPWPEARYREFLAAIAAAAGRQGRIVEELLFLARADAGGLARDVGPVCLLDALEEAAEAVSRPDRPRIRLESLDPSLMAPGSGSELTRLFTNLLENAVRHTPPGGTVTVSATIDATGVTVTVADTGEGIAPEHLPHLGERFYRVEAARSGGTGGTGLGLAICRSIVEAHGGRMTIESTVGEGTSVRVRLLLCPPRA